MGKQIAKSLGLKSTFTYNGDIYTTSFGKGEKSILQHKIDGNKELSKLSNNPVFDIDYDKSLDSINVIKEDFNLNINNPYQNNQIRQDYLMSKDILEKKYFGKTFDDNLHIQIAYNILDINKILSLYFYNIVYSLDNLKRNDNNDTIGNINSVKRLNNPLDDKIFKDFMDYASPYLEYYGTVFKTYDKRKSNVSEVNLHNYNVLRLLSFLRNNLTHNNNYLYVMDSKINNAPDLKDILKNTFNDDYNALNKGFNTNALKNLTVISNILGYDLNIINDKKEIFELYYKYSIFKDFKNIGINIKTIREKIYEFNQFTGNIKDKQHDSYRSKINTIFDFILYKFIHVDNPDLESNIINRLRSTKTDDEKEECYTNFSKLIFKSLASKYGKVVNLINEVRNIVTSRNIRRYDFTKELENVSKIAEPSVFTKIIYFVSKFLDTKEVNELYSSLINKLDNINGLKSLLYTLTNTNVKFSFEYRFFDQNLTKISDELRICKSITKMNNNFDNVKRQLYKDALTILNVSDDIIDDEDSFDELLDDILDGKKGEKQFRNFIINNVIKSKRFIYVIKYMNPRHCINFIRSKTVVEFVINELPKDQIIRYHNACFGSIECDINSKKKDLVNALINLNFDDIRSKENYIIQASKERNNKNVEYEKLKSIIGLYLTVIYLITKNLVKINSIYIIAMQCYDRDYKLLINSSSNNDCFNFEASLELLDRMINLNRYNKHTLSYLNDNIKTYLELPIKDLFKEIRNRTVHLNFISNAYKYLNISKMTCYYDLYQYIIQSNIIEYIKEKDNHINIDYINDVSKYNYYSKNMSKIIYLPFAYNLARYKNLTIADLFHDKYKNKEDK